jgi:hypothetical protein
VITTTALAGFERTGHRALDGLGGHRDNAALYRLAILFEAGVELLPQILAPGRVHRNYLALEAPLDQICDYRVAYLAGGHRGTHHGHGLGIEEKLKHRSITSSRELVNRRKVPTAPVLVGREEKAM